MTRSQRIMMWCPYQDQAAQGCHQSILLESFFICSRPPPRASNCASKAAQHCPCSSTEGTYLALSHHGNQHPQCLQYGFSYLAISKGFPCPYQRNARNQSYPCLLAAAARPTSMKSRCASTFGSPTFQYLQQLIRAVQAVRILAVDSSMTIRIQT